MKIAIIFVLIALAVCCIEGGSIRPMERPERPLERPEVPLNGDNRPSIPYKAPIHRPRPEEKVKLEDVPLLRPRPNENSAFPPLRTENNLVPLKPVVPLKSAFPLPRPTGRSNIEDVPLLRPIADKNSPVGY